MRKHQKCVLVAGGHGVIGRQAAIHFAKQPGTTVIGLSRRTGVELKEVRQISVDLLDSQDVRSKVGSLTEVTHIVFGAYIEKPTANERSEVNVAILRNLLDVVEALILQTGLVVRNAQGGDAPRRKRHLCGQRHAELHRQPVPRQPECIL